MMINKKGFTVVEFLFVSALVGVCLAVCYIVYQHIVFLQQDQQTVIELNQMNSALEWYYQKNSEYPVVLSPGQELGQGDFSCLDQTGFSDATCRNPLYPNLPRGYIYSSERGEDFMLQARLQGKVGELSQEIILTPEGVSNK